MSWSNFFGGFLGAAIGIFIPKLLLGTMDNKLWDALKNFAIRGMKRNAKLKKIITRRSD